MAGRTEPKWCFPHLKKWCFPHPTIQKLHHALLLPIPAAHVRPQGGQEPLLRPERYNAYATEIGPEHPSLLQEATGGDGGGARHPSLLPKIEDDAEEDTTAHLSSRGWAAMGGAGVAGASPSAVVRCSKIDSLSSKLAVYGFRCHRVMQGGEYYGHP